MTLVDARALRSAGRHRVDDDGDDPLDEHLDDGSPATDAVFEATPTPLLLLDADGTVLGANAAVLALVGATAGELLGTDVRRLVDEQEAGDVGTALARGATEPGGATLLCHVRPAGGTRRVVLLTVAVVGTSAGTRLVAHLADRTEQTELEGRLAHHGLHDPLTGLGNRLQFLERLQAAVLAAHATGVSTCVLVLDVEGMAEVNAVHGHAAGDLVLVELARRVHGAVRAVDTAVRLDRAVFTVLCEATEPEHGALVADRLCALTSGPYDVRGRTAQLWTSVRVAGADGVTDPAVAFSTLLHAADSRAALPAPGESPLRARLAAT